MYISYGLFRVSSRLSGQNDTLSTLKQSVLGYHYTRDFLVNLHDVKLLVEKSGATSDPLWRILLGTFSTNESWKLAENSTEYNPQASFEKMVSLGARAPRITPTGGLRALVDIYAEPLWDCITGSLAARTFFIGG
jgi:hypothetical protein